MNQSISARDAPEVRRERDVDRGVPARRSRRHSVVHGDVGAPEAVDGLLRVADERQLAVGEQPPRPSARARLPLAEEEDDLGLERIGVLELVDEDVVEQPLVLAATPVVVDQEVAELDQQIELVELAVARLLTRS